MDDKMKDKSIEILRGWAIIAVLLVHMSMYFKYSKQVDILVLTNIIIDVFAHCAVPLFLFISGFVLTLNHSSIVSYWQFYKKRFASVVPQYVLISLGYLLCFHQYKLDSSSLISVVKYLITFDASFHLWFFKIILEIYIFYPIIRKIYDYFDLRSQCKFSFLIALVLQLTWQVIDFAAPKNMLVQMLLFGTMFLGWVAYFILGMIVCSYRKIVEPVVTRNSRIVVTAILIALILVTIVWVNSFLGDKNDMLSIGRIFLEPILYGSMILYLFTASNTFNKSNNIFTKLLIYLGNYSFGIYLIHVFFLHIFVDFIAPTLQIAMNSGWFYIDLLFFMIMMSLVTINIVRKIPYYHIIVGKIDYHKISV